MVSYDRCGDDPVRVHHAFSMMVGDEQPYVRHLTVGPDGIKVDFGWVKEPGLLVIEAKPVHVLVMPTKEEREGIESRQLLISPGPHAFSIPAGFQGGVFVCSGPPAGLSIRANHGEVRVTITVFPR